LSLLDDGVKALTELPPDKISIGLGAGLVVVGVVQFRDDTVLLIGSIIIGLFLVLIGLVLGILRARAAERQKEKDIAYRKWLIEQGKPIENDKTILGRLP